MNDEFVSDDGDCNCLEGVFLFDGRQYFRCHLQLSGQIILFVGLGYWVVGDEVCFCSAREDALEAGLVVYLELAGLLFCTIMFFIMAV